MDEQKQLLLKRKLGKRLQELRQAADLTQEALVERMGGTVQHLHRVEAGQVDVRYLTLVSFSEHLGVDIAALFEEPQSLQRRVGRPPKKP